MSVVHQVGLSGCVCVLCNTIQTEIVFFMLYT